MISPGVCGCLVPGAPPLFPLFSFPGLKKRFFLGLKKKSSRHTNTYYISINIIVLYTYRHTHKSTLLLGRGKKEQLERQVHKLLTSATDLIYGFFLGGGFVERERYAGVDLFSLVMMVARMK